MSRTTVLGQSFAPGQCQNLAELENLNEETLLEELHIRYKKDIIYTYVGEILVAVNPYKTVANLYDDAKTKTYKNGVDKASVPPHIFAVADNAFQALLKSGKDQVCVISGESGAGKTESAKFFLKHIVELSKGTESLGLEERIINVNPLLEAFGNAQTLMNDNSSRFGKFLDLRFTSNLTITGAIITEYLLEKSRVVSQTPGEKNFHIFYYIFAGLDAAAQQKFQLGGPDEHRYLNDNDEALGYIKSKECLTMWKEVYRCFGEVGFTDTEKDNLFALLSGVLNIGNVEFSGDEAAHVSSSSSVLERVATQLGLDQDALELAFTTLVTITRGEEVIREYKIEQAEDCREATAKALYGRAFTWIVKRVNELLSPATKDKESHRISFLDIFGFECFDENSFEQLCINLANEQLQFFFNNHIFAMELNEYAKEGIDGSKITYENNQPVLDMILQRKPPGMLMILDEECNFPRASDETLIEKFHASYEKHKDYNRPPGNEAYFGVKHYAGDVRYEAEGFLEKNRDTLAVDIQAVMRLSSNPLVMSLFGADKEDAKHAKDKKTKAGRDRRMSRKNMRMSMKKVNASLARTKRKTVGFAFKESLEHLMDNLNACAPHFIRCIKPNLHKAAANWDAELVTKQLRYTGMLETTRIRREGYAVRPTFEDFMFRYKPLAYLLSRKPGVNAESCRAILSKTSLKGWQVGKTKVFLKYYHVDELNDLMRPLDGAAKVLQKIARGHVARKKYGRLLEAKRIQDERVANFVSNLERQAQGVEDVIHHLCEEDGRRPKDYFTGGPALEQRSYKKKELPSSVGRKGGAGGFKRAASVKWFKEVEMKKGAAVDTSGGFLQWFHGIISRVRSEQLLKPTEEGTFLVRVSESRFGYSLSFKFGGRIKHFMIDQTPDGRYMVVGNDRTFPGLNELVTFHSTHPLTDDGDCLLNPCLVDSDLSEFE